ncbi:MAG TPA: acyl-CoA dehydrogenase family protein [Candidatus Obscuribacterales bacterium]
MNTFLSSSQQALMDQYRAFAKKEIAPVARDLESQSLSLKDFLQKLGQSGYLSIAIPKEYGGQGGSLISQAIFAEVVGEYEPGLGLTLSSQAAVVEVLKKYGSENQKSRYLPLLARGEIFASLLVGEEKAGSDYEALETTAVLTVDGALIDGRKTWVVNGRIASLMIVAAREVKDGHKENIALWLVDSSEAHTVKVEPGPQKLGLRSAFTDNVILSKHPVPQNARLAGDGCEQITFALDVGKVILSAAAVGLAQAALDLAVNHARSREQFGTTIGQFQGVQWKLADLSTESQAARLLTYRAALSIDESPDQFGQFASMCKLFSSRVARLHSGEAMQVLGTRGISEDSPLERFYRDAKLMEICQGTSEMQKVRIADELKV